MRIHFGFNRKNFLLLFLIFIYYKNSADNLHHKSKKILLCSALKFEARVIIERLKLAETQIVDGIETFKDNFGKLPIYLCITGVGMTKSSFTVKKVFEAVEPKVILNFGLAGSLIESVKPGQLFIPAACKNIEGQEYQCDKGTLEKWSEYLALKNDDSPECNLISLDRPVNRREMRKKFKCSRGGYGSI